MNTESADLKQNLQALDDLLVRERHAIIHLRVGQMDEIRQEKLDCSNCCTRSSRPSTRRAQD